MNSFGRIFRISIFGESHGPGLGIVVDGCPPGIRITDEDFAVDLERRKSGRAGTTPRKESDIPEVISGIFNNYSAGSPVTLLFRNRDTRPSDYMKFKEIPRPGHADFTSVLKYRGYNDTRGSGHFSGRITAGLVAAGVIAKKILAGIEFAAVLVEAGGSSNIEAGVAEAEKTGDSIGGIIECRIKNLPAGLGEPFFDSAESVISHMVFSVPGIRGIEFGTGFKAAEMRGSEHNDCLITTEGRTATNNHGGINGGITNSNELIFRTAVKPTSSIPAAQKTINLKTGMLTEMKIEGRHDTCHALRVPVVIEAAAAIALADLYMINKCY